MLEHFVKATNSYAEKKKEEKRNFYRKFKLVPLMKEEMLRYIGVLLLLSVNSVRSYRLAWDPKSSQALIHLHDLMSRNRFENISAFFHVVTTEEEDSNSNDPLKKIRGMQDRVQKACAQYYHPLCELSIDERMVKSKARSHFRQYLKNKPTKWGFKYFVLADPTGYTLDFNLYCGARRSGPISEHGLCYDVVMNLIQMYPHQGYFLFMDNFYTSPTLVKVLKDRDIWSTGTLRINRKDIPESVLQLHKAMKRSDVPHGTGYYVRDGQEVYTCWKDSGCVTLLSNSYPGHKDGTTMRRAKKRSGEFERLEVPLPSAVRAYNSFMGGVDISDQLISYHRIIRKTNKYWKTLFYHLLEICVTNATILCNLMNLRVGQKKKSASNFRDSVVMAIISRHGVEERRLECSPGFNISHGSVAFVGRRKCAVCKSLSSRNCPSCPFLPALCQSTKRDCHGQWHSNAMLVKRKLWFIRQKNRLERCCDRLPSKRTGRPKGSRDKRKRVVH